MGQLYPVISLACFVVSPTSPTMSPASFPSIKRHYQCLSPFPQCSCQPHCVSTPFAIFSPIAKPHPTCLNVFLAIVKPNDCKPKPWFVTCWQMTSAWTSPTFSKPPQLSPNMGTLKRQQAHFYFSFPFGPIWVNQEQSSHWLDCLFLVTRIWQVHAKNCGHVFFSLLFSLSLDEIFALALDAIEPHKSQANLKAKWKF